MCEAHQQDPGQGPSERITTVPVVLCLSRLRQCIDKRSNSNILFLPQIGSSRSTFSMAPPHSLQPGELQMKRKVSAKFPREISDSTQRNK